MQSRKRSSDVRGSSSSAHLSPSTASLAETSEPSSGDNVALPSKIHRASESGLLETAILATAAAAAVDLTSGVSRTDNNASHVDTDPAGLTKTSPSIHSIASNGIDGVASSSVDEGTHATALHELAGADASIAHLTTHAADSAIPTLSQSHALEQPSASDLSHTAIGSGTPPEIAQHSLGHAVGYTATAGDGTFISADHTSGPQTASVNATPVAQNATTPSSAPLDMSATASTAPGSPELSITNFSGSDGSQTTQSGSTSFTTTQGSGGLTINVTYDQAVSSLPTGFVNAVDYVVSYFESLFTNKVTLNIDVGYGDLAGGTLGGALGASESNYISASYNTVKSTLVAENAPGSSTLPSTSPLSGSMYMSVAEAKAFGASNSGIDGYVGFSNSVSWDYTPNTAVSGEYYIIGTIEHEFSEVMGRVSLLDGQPSYYTPMDLFRYTAAGARDLSTGGSGSLAYFSTDGGHTLLDSWNNNPSNGDLGDWYGGPVDAANDYASSGVVMPWSATDTALMQAIGWTVASGPAAPSISSFSPDSGVTGDHITNATALTISGTATAGSTVNVYDGTTLLGTATANASGNWSFTTGTLSNGSHSFTATDTVSGSTSTASSALAVTVDTVAPTAPTIASFSPDTGVVGDHITDVNTLTLTGTAEANSTVKVYDGATLLGTAATNASGAWSYTTAALANGTHSLTATATDAAGNTSTTSSTLSVTVDTAAPVAPTISSFSPDTGVVGDHITDVNTLTLSGTAEANSTVKVYDGTTLLGTITANGSGAWSYTTAALSNGAHSLTTTATDAAGNISTASAALAVTVDTTAPVLSQVTASPATGAEYPGDTVTLSLHLSEAVTVTGTPTLTLNDGGIATYASGSGSNTLTFSYTVGANDSNVSGLAITAVNLPNGATIGDVAGNSANLSGALTSFPNLQIDPVGTPVVTSFSPDSGISGDGITNTNSIVLTGTATANSTVTIYDGSTQIGTAASNGSGVWSFTTATLSDGSHGFTVTDTAGGVTSSPSLALNVTIDTSAPAAPTITTFSPDTGLAGDQITDVNALTLTGTAEANATVKVYDGTTLLGTATATSSGTWSYATAALVDGSHSLTATATDAAGNVSGASAAMDVTIDTAAPAAPPIAAWSPDTGMVGDGVTDSATLTLIGTAEANSTVKIYDGATLLGTATTNSSGAWNYTTASLGNGTHSFTATATDAAGNTGAHSSALSVTVDTVAPVAPSITSFSPDSGIADDGITNNNTPTLTGSAEANSTVKIYDGTTLLGTATTNSSGAWSYTTDTLNDGTHNLTATDSDAAGNTSIASAAFNITIDTVAPAAPTITSCSPDTGMAGDDITNSNVLTLTGTAEAGSKVTIYDGAAAIGFTTADADGTWAFNTSSASDQGDQLADGGLSFSFMGTSDGVHVYTATATDAASNTSVASSALTVTVDTVAPTAPTISSFSPDTDVIGDGITDASTITLTGTAEANSTVKVYDGTTLLGTATANSSGAWSYTAASLGNGSHSFTATATDVAGNTSAASTALTVTVDTVAPIAPTIASFSPDTGVTGDGVTDIGTIVLTGTAQANSTVKVYDGATLLGTAAANSSGVWSYTAASLGNGTHGFTATATDAAGNTSSASAVLSVTIDTIAPAAPTISSFSPDTGLAGDHITDVNTIALIGTAEANSTVKIYDGTTLLGTATANSSGVWSYTTGTLTNTTHSFTATATDVAGNTSSASAALSVTVDTAAPSAPTIASFSPDTGVVGDHITDVGTIALTGTAEADSTVKIFDGATLLGTAAANSSGAWSYTTAALSNGSHSLTATATDAAGNTSAASSALSVIVDTVAPVAPTIASFSPDSGVVGDGITDASTITLTGTAEANATVKVYDGATLLGTATANSSGAWSYTAAALSNATHSFTATATDAAGNTSSASSALSVTVDTVAPVTPTITTFSPDTGMAGDHTTDASTLTLTGTAEANSTVKIYDGVTLLGTATANSSGVWSYTTGTLTNATHSFTATATDFGGNTSSASATLSVTVDMIAPVAPTITSFSPDTGAVGDHITDVNTLALTGTAESNSTVKVYDGATLLGTVIANGSGAWSFTTAALSDGAHSLTATATDIAGNTSTTSTALSVTIDTVAPAAPTITSFSPDSDMIGDGITGASTITLAGTAEANSTVKVYDGATLLGTAMTNASGAWSYSTASLSNGIHNFTATATDVAGNASTASSALSVTVDTVAPVAPTITTFSPDTGVVGDHITDASTLTLTGTAEANSTVKVYDGATLLGTVTANGSGAWTFTSSTLANGTHSFTVTATDVAGNTSTSSSALSVIVDTLAPVAPTIASFSPDSGMVGDHITDVNTLALTGTAEANSTVKIYDGATLLGTATANSSGAWSYTTAALSDGAHSLTTTATDVAGNTSTASTALSVTIDTEAPVAPTITSFSPDSGVVGDGITNATVLTLTGTAEANSTLKVYDGATLLGTATANSSGVWSFTTTTLGNGTHNFTATDTDVAGNTSTASSPLNVAIDTGAPVVTVSLANDTGSSTTDKVTSNPTLTGVADANAVVHFTVDGTAIAQTATANGSGVWTFTPTGLTDGAHTIVASETDTTGNTGTASLSFTLDTTAPAAPTVTSFSPDSGVVGGITDASTIALTGTAEANSTVKVYDGATLLGTATANSDGAWSYTTSALSDGAHSLIATATDMVGNTSTASSALSVIVDTIAPVAPTIASFSPDTGVVGDGITDTGIIALTGAAEAFSTVKVYDGSTLLGTATANSSGAWSYTTATLSNGAHSLSATATDTAGNISTASSAVSVAVDTVAPTVAESLATDTGFSSTDKITSSATLTGSGDPNAVVHFTVDGTAITQTATANASGVWSFAPTGLADGTHTVVASEIDAAGNNGTASLTFTLDTAAPVVTQAATSPASGTQDPGDTVTITVNLSEAVKVAGTPTLTLNDGGIATYAGGSGSNVLTFTYAVGASDTTVSTLAITAVNMPNGAAVTDAAGNNANLSGAVTSFPGLMIDPPGAPVISSVTPDTGVLGDDITSATVLTLAGTAMADSTVNVYDGATLLGTAAVNGSGTWSFTTGTLADGAHNFTATDTDSGITGAPSHGLNVTVDTVAPFAPTIASFSPDSGVAGDGITDSKTVTLTGTADANSTVKVYDGTTLLGSAIANSSGSWSYTTSTLVDGTHSLTATATDIAGNTSGASSVMSVTVDTVAPAIVENLANDTGASSIDKTTSDATLSGSGNANAVVHFTVDGTAIAQTATADASGAWTFTPTGLADGSHTIVASETDATGNTGSSALTFTLDTTPPDPTITSESDRGHRLQLKGHSEANSTVYIYDASHGTLLGATTASSAGAWAFSQRGIAVSSLLVTAVDLAGNSSMSNHQALAQTATPVVTEILANDTGASATDFITSDAMIKGWGDANAIVHFSVDGSQVATTVTADSNGAWSFTPAGLTDGVHTIVASETDAIGNTGTSSLTFTLDRTPPDPIITKETHRGTSVQLKGTSDPNTTVSVFDAENGSFLGTAKASSKGIWSFAGRGITAGSFSVTALDIAGNSSPLAPRITSFASDIGLQSDHVTSDTSPALTGTAEANDTVQVYDGTILLGSTTVNGSGNWAFNTTDLINGVHHLTAVTFDGAGNNDATSTIFNLTVDSAAPQVPSITSDVVVNANQVVLTGTAEANSTVTIYDGGSVFGTASVDHSGHWQLDTGSLADGDHSFAATATDAAGNSSAVSPTADVNIDAPQPSILVTADTLTVRRGMDILSGTSEARSTVTIHDENGDTINTTTNRNGTWSVHIGDLSDSIHNFVVSAHDAAGNIGSVDVLFGTSHDDLITNTAPNELLIGNGGNDIFAFTGTVGKDTIMDFRTSDVLQFSHNVFTDFADVLAHAAQVGSDVTIAISQSNTITLHDASLNHLTSSNVHIV